jgi:hypothetical protein
METRETIRSDARAQQRLGVLTHVLAGRLTLADGAAYLRLSERQVRRLMAGLSGPRGAAALVHGNTGRTPANRLDETRRGRIRELADGPLKGFNGNHMADVLAEEEPDLAVSAKTLLRVLADAGVPRARTRRPARHTSRRERMPREGMLLQTDGSRHDWLEGRGPVLTLLGLVDDATGRYTGATFRAQEDAAGYLDILARTVRAHGVPLAVSSDRHGIFRPPDRPPTLAEQLTGMRGLSQVGRALHEAGVGWIGARSPQAKGRIERAWGTAQDRLASELRRAGAMTLEDANEVLARYLPRHAGWFGVPAADPAPAWRAWSSPWPIESVLSFHYPRRAAADDTLPWDGRTLAIPRLPGGGQGRRTVTVEEHLDGSLWVRDGTAHGRLAEAPPSAPVLRARQRSLLEDLEPVAEPQHPDRDDDPVSAGDTWRPAADHPWRAGYDRRHPAEG